MASIEREVEKALLNVVSGISGVNFYTSERSTARTMPSVTIQAQIGSEELVPFSGVFKTPATITYVARADTTARADFDAKFYDILEQLYRDPDLASYLTDHSNITFYVAKVTGDTPAVISQNRTWSRAMTLDIMATAVKPFVPSSLSGLSLWLKADVGVTTSGSNVTAWADQSENNRNVTAVVSPTFVASAINSKPAIQFSGAQSLTGDLDFNLSSDNAIFIVFNAGDVDAGAFVGQGIREYISTIAEGYTGISNSNRAVIVQSNTASIINNSYIFSSINSSNTFTIYLNGNQTGSAFYDGLAGIGTQLYIGADYANNDYSYWYSGYISEIIIYNRAVTTQERQQVEAYLNAKYGIY
jgi:hypothetical protein